MIQLQKMPQAEFELYYPKDLQHLADELAKARDLTAEESLRQATASYDSLFPTRQVSSPDQFVFSIVDGGRKVGTLHFGIRRDKAFPYAWIWNIEIAPEFRGKGYAKQALVAMESEVKILSISSIGLNVFGHNSTAIHLYRKLNYQVASMSMYKDLGL